MKDLEITHCNIIMKICTYTNKNFDEALEKVKEDPTKIVPLYDATSFFVAIPSVYFGEKESKNLSMICNFNYTVINAQPYKDGHVKFHYEMRETLHNELGVDKTNCLLAVIASALDFHRAALIDMSTKSIKTRILDERNKLAKDLNQLQLIEL